MSPNLGKKDPTMLETLFKYPAVLPRRRNAPFFEERARYLKHFAQRFAKGSEEDGEILWTAQSNSKKIE